MMNGPERRGSRLPCLILVPSLTVLLAILVFASASAGTAPLKGNYLGQTPPGNEPRLFAPGVVSTGLYERDVTMTPDANEIYFGLLAGDYATIALMRRHGETWTGPEIAPFSTDPRAFDLEPHITPDGKRFLFLSTRPREGGEWKPGWANQDIWIMDRTGSGWGKPYNPGPPVNSEAPEYFPSVARDGTLYFTREIEEDGRRRSLILRSRPEEGRWGEPVTLPPEVNPGDNQFNACIDPGERFLVIGMTGREDAIGQADYYVAFRGDDDSWTGPINLGESINTPDNRVVSPYISPDGRYFFFASTRKTPVAGGEQARRQYAELHRMRTRPQNGNADIYWVDASFILALRPD